MKALAIIIQTKRGENAFVVTSNNFTQELAQEYSHAIYNVIIRSFKKSQRVDRTFLFKRDLSAVCNISKDVIIQIIVPNNEIQYGVECLKKANELLTRHAKNETTLKKYTEIFYNLEELIYSRDYSPIKLQLTLKPSEIQSAKKSIDNDLFAKFPLLTHEGEKALIQTVPLKYSKRAFTHHREAHLRYQVAKTCQFPATRAINQETELKRFYRHNLSNNAFNKTTQARPSLYGKAVGRQSSIKPASYTNPVHLPSLDDEPQPSYQMPAMSGMLGMSGMSSMPGIKGLGDLNLSHAAPAPSYENRPKVINVMDLYASTPSVGNKSLADLNLSYTNPPTYGVPPLDTSYNQGSPALGMAQSDNKPRRKIFETNEEKKDASFNTFSHDMFNTVSLPAQLNAGPSMDSINKSRGSPPYDNARPNYLAPEPSREQSWNPMGLSPGLQNSSRLDQFDSRGNQGFNSGAESMRTLPDEPETHRLTYIKLLKIMEKFYLTLQNAKVQNIKIVGQVAIEIDDNDGLPAMSLLLTPSNIWEDESKIIKRPSRKEFFMGSTGSFSVLQLGRLKGNVPLYDYLVNQKSFDAGRIPMFFIYKVEEAGMGRYNFLMQYKMNEKLNQTFYEVEITAVFKVDISRFAVKAMPTAQKIADKSVYWRTKSLSPDSKGKLCISLENCTEPAAKLLEEVKITLKGLTVVHEEMDAYASFQPNVSPQQYRDPSVFKAAQKRQIIEYKILPNTQ